MMKNKSIEEEEKNASTGALKSYVDNDHVGGECVILLDKRRTNSPVKILERIRSGCIGVCAVPKGEDEQYENEHNRSIQRRSVSEGGAHRKACSYEISDVANTISNPDDDICTHNVSQKKKKLLTFQFEVHPLLSMYLMTMMVYSYHFGDTMIEKIVGGIRFLRNALEPYAANIVTLQLILLPLFGIIYVGLRPPVVAWKDAPKPYSKSSAMNDPVEEKEKLKDERTKMVLDPKRPINVDLAEATANLPDVIHWKHRPVFIQPAGDTRCPGQNMAGPMPIGVPFKFESNLFKGQILFRLKDGKSDDPDSSHAYFNHGTQNKIHRQVVIQGQFKRPLKMSELWFGDIYDKKMSLSSPPRMARLMSKLFNRLIPGIILDLSSNRPKILSLLGSGSHNISIDEPGEEPDITAVTLPERTHLSNDLESSEARKRILGNPETAAVHECDPDLVYTFHTFDEFLDIADYRLRLPFMTVDFTKVLGEGQPLSFRVVTAAVEDVESLFYFRIWHERTLNKKRKKQGRLAAKFNVSF